MLRQHRRGVSAALAQKNQTNALANFIIKKPIRTKQLVEVLNAAEEQIKVAATKQTEKPPAPKTILSPKKAKPKTKIVDETTPKPAKKHHSWVPYPSICLDVNRPFLSYPR